MKTENKHIYHYKNTDIHYVDQGKGNTVIFLHGFLENKNMWDTISSTISERYRTISIDLLGHGDSGCIGYVHTMEEQADMIFSLISSLKLRKITLVGHSMGGYVALAFAELYPDHIRGLALLNSTSRSDSELRQINRDRAIIAVKKNADLFVRLAISNLFTNAENVSENTINEIIKSAQKTSLQGVIASIEGMKIRSDREVLLHFGPYPKLMIAGKKDTLVVLDEITEQAEGTETQVEILDCGHMSIVEKQKEVLYILQQFLKKL